MVPPFHIDPHQLTAKTGRANEKSSEYSYSLRRRKYFLFDDGSISLQKRWPIVDLSSYRPTPISASISAVDSVAVVSIEEFAVLPISTFSRFCQTAGT